MKYEQVYFADGENAAIRWKTVCAHSPAVLIARLEEEGLLEADPTARKMEGGDPGLGDEIKTCIRGGKTYLITRNTRFGYLSIERSVAGVHS